MADVYDEAAERWARGMRAAQPFIRERARAQSATAKANRGKLGPCGIAGCNRSAYKGRLCRKHYAMVPYSERSKTMIAVTNAQMHEARKAHKRYLGIVRRLVREQSP